VHHEPTSSLWMLEQISAISSAQRMIGIIGGEEDAKAGSGKGAYFAHDFGCECASRDCEGNRERKQHATCPCESVRRTAISTYPT
jgi:hypothetical protein